MKLRTNEEILASLACTKPEAARLLAVGWRTMDALVKDKKVQSYKSGKRIKIVVRSLIEYQGRESASA